MEWTQVYDPLNSVWLSTALAALPIVLLLGLLGIANWPAPRAALTGLAAAILVATLAYGMPWSMALAAAMYGAGFGLFPIGWIVLNAIFLYTLTVEAGRFEIVKRSVTGLSEDRRIQAILIAFSFGAFIEGAAGFGTPVAISSALLVGAGFPPLLASGVALIANTAPVAFGALGTPISTLAQVTGLPEMQLSAMAGRQLPFFSLVVPAWMVWIMSGWRGVRGVWPALLISGGSFALLQFILANYIGPTLVDVGAGLTSLILLAVFLRYWQPAQIWQFPDQSPAPSSPPCVKEPVTDSRAAVWSAWVPWAILSLSVLVWGLPAVRDVLNGGRWPAKAADAVLPDGDSTPWWQKPNWLAGVSELRFDVPGLHHRVCRDVPAVEHRGVPEEAVFRLNWLSTTGTGIWVAALLSAAWMGVPPTKVAATFGRTVARMRWPLVTIAAMLAIAYVTRYSGTDVTLGLAFTRTGVFFPFFSAMLGWLGVALTGSDTSSNALFGNLQKVTAEQLGLPSVLMCTANSTGGVMGKMIDAQSIVVAAAATQQPGQEGQILRFVFWHSLSLAALMGLLTLLQAYVFPWMIPAP